MSAFARLVDADAHRISKRRWQRFCTLWRLIGNDLFWAEWDKKCEELRAQGIDPITLGLNQGDE